MQVELNELNNALGELKKSGDEVYRILSGLMIKANKDSLSKELNERKKVLDLRNSAIDKQEKSVEERADRLRNEINEKITAKKP